MKTKIKNPARVKRRVQNQKLKSFNVPIIGDSSANSQASPSKKEKFTNLIGKIRDKQLTESLELIEQSGFAGEAALFMLGEIQEVWA